MTNPCFACKSMANQLFLVGYMGAGKTTAANALSLRTGLPMVDLDEELERREGRSIAALFAQEGEMAFRIKESDLLNEIAGNPAFPIVACGGGTMGNATNVRTMQAHGHVLWIDPPFEVILERLRANPGGRPLLATMGDPFDEEVLRAHFAQRQSAYAKSNERIRDLSEEVLAALADRISRGA